MGLVSLMPWKAASCVVVPSESVSRQLPVMPLPACLLATILAVSQESLDLFFGKSSLVCSPDNA